MITILIVDDEKLARSDILYKVGRSGFDFKWVMEATSAEEAIEMIKKYKPDILLADIMMGEMSGLDLIREAKKNSINTISILITGYPEFSYAKEAIALGVVEYLLKPVRQDELTAALTSAVKIIERQRNTHRIPDNKGESVHDLLSDRQREELFALLNGEGQELNYLPSKLFSEKAIYYQIALLRFSLPNVAANEKIAVKNDYVSIIQQIKDIIGEIDNKWIVVFRCFNHKRQVVVIAGSEHKEQHLAQSIFIKNFEEIFCKIHKKLNLNLFIGISELSKSLTGLLLGQARQALDLRFSLKSKSAGQIFYWKEYEKFSANTEYLEEDIRIYQRFLEKGDLNNAEATVRRIFSSELETNAMHIRIIYIELICILARTYTKRTGESIVSLLGSENLNGNKLDIFEDREEIIESLCRTINTALSQWININADTSLVLQNIKKYIETNFTNTDLTSSKLSEQFCISLGYLSTSFKKEYDITISKYIICLRVDYAKKLLKETNLTINKIAENSGFNNYSYFVRTFKKYIGDTPSDYRKKIHLDSEVN